LIFEISDFQRIARACARRDSKHLNMAVTVRQATRKDARRVAEFAIKLFAQHRDYDARRFAEIASIEGAERFYGSQTDGADAAVLVAELENKVVGFAYIQYEAMDYANLLENAAWLHDIYIEEASRGSNAGKLLIEKSIEVAKELGADKLMLSVAAKNEFARAFFERRGFRETMVEMMLDLTG
jgi:GNAT superfamily N-acetyltransferase